MDRGCDKNPTLHKPLQSFRQFRQPLLELLSSIPIHTEEKFLNSNTSTARDDKAVINSSYKDLPRPVARSKKRNMV
jgi:hypothetical protein